jgi:hypothetical protein
MDSENNIRKGISSGLMGSVSGEEFEYDAETSRLLNLIDACEDVDVFKHSNRMFFGNKIQAVKNYIKDNPKSDNFLLWLQKNYKEING